MKMNTKDSKKISEPRVKRLRTEIKDENIFDEMKYVEEQNDDSLLSKDKVEKWNRKRVVSQESIEFQWIDIDMLEMKRDLYEQKQQCVKNPVIRFFGVTNEGNSVCAHIHGFIPYGYFSMPENVVVDESRLPDIEKKLEEYLRATLRNFEKTDDPCVLSVSVIKNKKSIMGYNNPDNRFLKIEVRMPSMIPGLKRLMDSGVSLPGITNSQNEMKNAGASVWFAAFECNVPFVLRYMIDRGITGACWLNLPKDTFVIRKSLQRKTHCQVEVDVFFDDVVVLKECSKIAPLRILSIDIECQGRKGHFPEAERDPVIQIANVLTTYGRPDVPNIQAVFTLKSCNKIVGAEVISSSREEEMLMKWKEFLQECDPDIITGYNVQNFDIPYLLDRGQTLSKKNKALKQYLGSFFHWGRIENMATTKKETMFSSSAYGRRTNIETAIHGRVIFDMLPYMQRNHKLSSYTLNSVCAEFLGKQKEDVHYSIISDLQNGSDEDRHRLAVYCLKDALLPYQLMQKLSVLINYVEMSRVTGVPISFLISRGQQIKVFSMILRKCRCLDLLVPTLSRAGTNTGEGEAGYEGATVLDPIKKYYRIPIATLDFASLYPSIMQAWNLCYSTMVSNQQISKIDSSLYHKTENGHYFITSKTQKGILPIILEELLKARKQAKKDMKNAPTEFEKAVQNGRQLALKISANSVYGFTGAGVGQLPCLAIASSVTSYGRMLLERTKSFVEQTYTIANGYKHDAQVIYGDTDSVMVKFGTQTVSDTFPLAEEAAEKCTNIFPNPIKLEFEKVYFPYLLMNKKRYAGLMWTNVEKYDAMDTKGLETVRRDNCALVRDVIQTCLDKILIQQDVDGSIQYVKSQISDLLQNKMDISQLVITKSLNKGAEYVLGLGGKKDDYKIKQAHVELAARMKKRDPGSAPQMGDRVPYVIIAGMKGAATYDRAEDPLYVLENNIPIDCKWYLSNQLSKPLTRIYEPIIENVEKSLLQGDHTRKIFIPTPTARKGSLMMFATKKASCLGCGVVTKQDFLCKHCIPIQADIYLKKLKILREAETRYAKLWSAAQRIHGTIHTEIICRGDGCTCQFYRRVKAQNDVRLALETIEKFT